MCLRAVPLTLSMGTLETSISIRPGQLSRLTFEMRSESAKIPTTCRLSSTTTTRLCDDETSSTKISSTVSTNLNLTSRAHGRTPPPSAERRVEKESLPGHKLSVCRIKM